MSVPPLRATGWWDGPMLGFDLETTTVDNDRPDPLQDIPVSYSLAEVGGGRPPDTIRRLVDPGCPIAPATTKIHGITDEMAKVDGEPLDMAGGYILDRLANASHRGIPVVGMNLAYDLTIVNRLSWERGLPRTFAATELGCAPRPCIDLQVIDKQIDPYRLTKGIGGRTLANICAQYGVKHEGAHDALQDTLAACRAVWKIGKLSSAGEVYLHDWYEARRDSYNQPRGQYRGSTPWLHQFQALRQINGMDLAELHAAQVVWRNEQARHLQEYLRTKGGEPDAEVHPYWPVIPCGLEDRPLYPEEATTDA